MVKTLNLLMIGGAWIFIYGLILVSFPPKFNNNLLGIRTNLTSKNPQVWKYGQKVFGISLSLIGIVLFVFGLFQIDTNAYRFSALACAIILWFVARYISHSILLKKFPELKR